MREHLQSLLIAHEILEVIQNEDADALFGIRDILEPRFEFFENGGEGMFLNEIQQALFGLEVVIKPGQRHAGGARKIAHGSAFVSFDTKDFGGMVEDLSEAAVETGRPRHWSNMLLRRRGARVEGRVAMRSNVRSNYSGT